MDIKEFFGTDWRAKMSKAELVEAKRLNALCPLDRAIAGCKKWSEEGEFKNELKWNLWAKAYKDDFLEPIKEGEEDPFGNGMRQLKFGEDVFEEKRIDFAVDQMRNDKDQYNIDSWSFSHFIFPHVVDFSRAIFIEDVYFRGTIFTEDTKFSGAIFTKDTYFEGAIFTKAAIFGEVGFSECVDFSRARFIQQAFFRNTTFTKPAIFEKVIFYESTNFVEAIFTKYASFQNTTFTKIANFRSAIFSEFANFKDATITEQGAFKKTLFGGHGEFESITAEADLNFDKACFLGGISIRQGTIKGNLQLYEVGFGSTRFAEKNEEFTEQAKNIIKAYKSSAQAKTVPDFTGLQVPVTPDISFTDIKYHPDMVDELASAKFRKLKEMAGQTLNHSKELEYFREELIHRKYSGEKGRWTVGLIWLYEKSSRCGTNALIPAFWLSVSIVLFAGIYLGLNLPSNTTPYDGWQFVRFSFHQAVPFLGMGGGEADAVVNYLFNGYDGIPPVTGFLSGFQRAISLALEFLIGLGIRNYYRM